MYTYYLMAVLIGKDEKKRKKYLWWGRYLTQMQMFQFFLNLCQSVYTSLYSPYPKFISHILFFYMISSSASSDTSTTPSTSRPPPRRPRRRSSSDRPRGERTKNRDAFLGGGRGASRRGRDARRTRVPCSRRVVFLPIRLKVNNSTERRRPRNLPRIHSSSRPSIDSSSRPSPSHRSRGAQGARGGVERGCDAGRHRFPVLPNLIPEGARSRLKRTRARARLRRVRVAQHPRRRAPPPPSPTPSARDSRDPRTLRCPFATEPRFSRPSPRTRTRPSRRVSRGSEPGRMIPGACRAITVSRNTARTRRRSCVGGPAACARNARLASTSASRR